MRNPPADWQLPPGVGRDVWEYARSEGHARGYDAALEGTPLLDVDRAFAEKHFPAPGRLLDLGCGTGRTLLHFAGKGYWAVGVDLSEEMLRIAGEKASAAGLAVPLVRANVVELDCLADGSFDYAACLFSTLGMVSGAGNRLAVVRHAYRLLRPGGTFVLHVHNRWFGLWDRAGRRWLLGEAVKGLFRKGETGDRRMPAHQGLAGLTLHHFTRREAVRLLREAGFRVTEVRPVGTDGDGRVPWPWWFGWARAYGYLLAARREPVTAPP